MKNFAIIDIGREHLMTVDGNWFALPIPEYLLLECKSFETRAEAEEFCLEQLKTGSHCRPYAVAFPTEEELKFAVAW